MRSNFLYFVLDPAVSPHQAFETIYTKMASNPQEDPKPDGAAFDEFFDSIGKKAENLTINEDGKPATNGTDSTSLEAVTEPEVDEPKIVDEIESLCMNCHANVCSPVSSYTAQANSRIRESLVSSSLESLSSAKS